MNKKRFTLALALACTFCLGGVVHAAEKSAVKKTTSQEAKKGKDPKTAYYGQGSWFAPAGYPYAGYQAQYRPQYYPQQYYPQQNLCRPNTCGYRTPVPAYGGYNGYRYPAAPVRMMPAYQAQTYPQQWVPYAPGMMAPMRYLPSPTSNNAIPKTSPTGTNPSHLAGTPVVVPAPVANPYFP